jgi:hypothetical protein
MMDYWIAGLLFSIKEEELIALNSDFFLMSEANHFGVRSRPALRSSQSEEGSYRFLFRHAKLAGLKAAK